MIRKLYTLFLLFITPFSLSAINISGKIEYQRIHPKHIGTHSFLNKSNTTLEVSKQVLVEIINDEEETLFRTFTNDKGQYYFEDLEENIKIKIRVYARMLKESSWDLKVLNNKDQKSLYAIEGKLHSTGTRNSIRNLIAPSSNKTAPPFAILDSIYLAMKKVKSIDSHVNFPPLNIYWSTNNINTGSYYDGTNNIILQGDQKGDSDEYDKHIIIHEWGHFFEEKLSRSDNIGGEHGENNHLDIRVAFGEGFGNALSAMVTDDPIYFDTFNNNGWNMNIEEGEKETSGWFSEASVQRILYDLYDKHQDANDKLELGFKPIYQVLTNGQKETPAFTSIFSFIHELKKSMPQYTDEIDAIVAEEEIATIDDSYGSNRLFSTQDDNSNLYTELTINQTLTKICTSNNYGIFNKLNNHKFIYFNVENNNSYPFKIQQYNGKNSNPEYSLFKTHPFKKISVKNKNFDGKEETTLTLEQGEYLIDIYDENNVQKACFNLLIGKVSSLDFETPSNNSKIINQEKSVGINISDNKLLMIFFTLLVLFIPLFFIKKELKI